MAEGGNQAGRDKHWLRNLVPFNEDPMLNANLTLGLHVHGIGLGWSPSEIARLHWSEIQFYAKQVTALWERMNPKKQQPTT